MKPTVSICLPNLRNRAYLPERIDSIFAQTLTDWELIIFDNYSDDGAWEYLRERTEGEPRVQLAQAQREGMYANWNNCIRAASGRYIYIATSDDTMAADCLEKLVAALDSHPECGIAHCRLLASGDNAAAMQRWWESESFIAVSNPGGGVAEEHIRFAPLDGLFHASGLTVIISITQALIRREVFEKIGHFPTDCGVVGDFEWHARASWTFNSIYVPSTWGGWRLHQNQATALNADVPSAKVQRNLHLYQRAIADFVADASSGDVTVLAKVSLKIARVYAAHVNSRGRAPFFRIIILIAELVKSGLVSKLFSWGPVRVLRYVTSPSSFAIAESAALRAAQQKCQFKMLEHP